ncbi:MAG TPA: hydantoinase/oxoprolinase family protein [Candidatus Binataceae bacterium]|nr:hydantoinase/oxoprolinase family protein [Candidatus Binataceae bacterium]
MKRVAVDIGGTFTDCFVVWDGRVLETKALTTHHNLALGFNEALDYACTELGIERQTLLSQIDSLRYATTLGTNALIERKGPNLGLLITHGFESTVPISRGRGYGDGLSTFDKMNMPSAKRPQPLVPIPMIRGVRERIDWAGNIVIALDEDDLRRKIRELVDNGVEALVVSCVNSVVNKQHERRIREIFVEEYPRSMLGAIPIILGSEVSGRRGEYVRTSSAIIDAYLHSIMYHAMSRLELNLRDSEYRKPMLMVHNSGGMAQVNSTDALQTAHSGPVAGIHAGEKLAEASRMGNIVTTDMGGTSFDIGIVVEGGVKFYDFNPVIDRFLVTLPMVHLASLGAGGGSIARYDPTYRTIKVGPDSAGSDPGPACYERGGMNATVTDADLLLGYLDAANYAHGRIRLNPEYSSLALEPLCEALAMSEINAARLVRRRVDNDMAIGIVGELSARGLKPDKFTMLAYGGNGPLHACGIASAAGINRVLVPPFASVFSACGAGTLQQMHIHEYSHLTDLYNPLLRSVFDDYDSFNRVVEMLEERGRQDLMRQGFDPARVQHRLELDIRYGTQSIETAIECDRSRIRALRDVLRIIEKHAEDFRERYGEASRAPESGIRITTYRVVSWVEGESVRFDDLTPGRPHRPAPTPVGTRRCWFPTIDKPFDAPVYDQSALMAGVAIDGPAIVNPGATTYLIEPGWRYEAVAQGAVWLTRDSDSGRQP